MHIASQRATHLHWNFIKRKSVFSPALPPKAIAACELYKLCIPLETTKIYVCNTRSNLVVVAGLKEQNSTIKRQTYSSNELYNLII